MPNAIARWLSQRRPWSVGAIAMAGAGAIAWVAGLAPWQVLAVALAATGVALVPMVARRITAASPSATAARVRSPAGDFDPDEMIAQDANSGRIWRLGEVHFLGAAEKRRLAAERPQVWKAYRARVFPFPERPLRRDDDDTAARGAAPPNGGD